MIQPGSRLPVLTEVVSVAGDGGPETVSPGTEALGPEGVAIDEAQLTQKVLADVQRQVDLLLEQRLREAIAPVLARASEQLIRDLRVELASALRETVARAVAQELARRQGR